MIVTVVDKWSLSFAGNVGIRVVLTSGRGPVHSRVPRDFCLPVRPDRSDRSDRSDRTGGGSN